jgi:putative zinc finger/helix-turn-helix YgiT family protein
MHPAIIDYTTEMEHDGRAYTVSVPNLDVFRCDQCQAKALPDASYEKLADVLRRQAGLLMPSEIATKRTALGLNQKDFAQLLGVAPETVSRWETGGQIQQRVMNDFMRAFFDLPALQDYLKRLRGVDRSTAGGPPHVAEVKPGPSSNTTVEVITAALQPHGGVQPYYLKQVSAA